MYSDGDHQVVNGITYELRNSCWHRVDPKDDPVAALIKAQEELDEEETEGFEQTETAGESEPTFDG